MNMMGSSSANSKTMATTLLIKRRIAAAIRGAFIADAASMGTHWIYDPQEMVKTLTDPEKPEFQDPPSPKFYSSNDFPGHYSHVGMLSPYGEQLLFVTEHVATLQDTQQQLEGATMSEQMLEWATTFGGRPDSALNTFVENMQSSGEDGPKKPWPECGADDDQAHIYMKIVPVVGKYAGSSDLVERVTKAIQVHQNNQRAIAFGIVAARILEAVILGASLSEALDTVQANLLLRDDNDDADHDLKSIPSEIQEQIKDAFVRGKQGGNPSDEINGNKSPKTLDEFLLEISHEMMKGKEDSPFYNLAGRSCGLPGSFMGPIAIFYKYASNPNAFAPAIRENILGSGDTCSRAVFIGAVLAAGGVEDSNSSDDALKSANGLPDEWITKMDTDTLARIDAAIATIISD